MKRFFGLWTVVALICVTSCTSYKNVPYMINSDEVALMANLSEARITPKDELIITVSCPDDPAAVLQFNLTVSSNENTGDRTKLTSQEVLLPYLVRNDGTIDFPALGEIKVAGMTEDELEDYFNAYTTECISIKTEIENTDKEIDQMVYELYGLSEDEVKVVEGK